MAAGGGACASGVIVLTIGAGFVVPPPTCTGCGGWVAAKETPHVLQNTASSALLLPQAGHCRILEPYFGIA